ELLVPFKPKRSSVDDIIDALKAETHLSAAIPPCWLEVDSSSPSATEIIVCNNGLLHWPKFVLRATTPLFFATTGLPFNWDSSIFATPVRWLKFLSELWPNDQECIDLLQEWMGYLLTPDTRQQKIVLLIGPRRSGKGTIARTIKRLIGEQAYCGPTLASFSSNFGLSPLIGKFVAVIPDARLGTMGTAAITERLLSISGEDTLSIDRKHLPHWTGKLPARLMILTNELPNIPDTSSALAGRFLILRATESFYGKEDPDLSTALEKELPA